MGSNHERFTKKFWKLVKISVLTKTGLNSPKESKKTWPQLLGSLAKTPTYHDLRSSWLRVHNFGATNFVKLATVHVDSVIVYGCADRCQTILYVLWSA